MFGDVLSLFWNPSCRRKESKFLSALPFHPSPSKQGLNMGFAKSHPSSVALIMNLSTKSISAQFHTVFDDCFSTVPNSEGAIDPDKWSNIVSCRSAEESGMILMMMKTTLNWLMNG